jgi:hypothetical protein
MRPLARAPALLHTLADDLPWHHGTGFVKLCIDRCSGRLECSTEPGHIVHAAIAPVCRGNAGSGRQAWTFRPWNGCLELLARGGGVHRIGRLRLLLRPAGLGIDLREAHAAPGAPGTADGAGHAAEVRDHLSAAAAGHTLPRPLGPVRIILAVACLVRHEAMRLAFRA